MIKIIFFTFLLLKIVSSQFNPTILQDTRDLPKLDGTFGFLYRTEDGIAHGAKADPGGIVHGRFTYTDPTGLKVNYNYNAGSSVTPKYNYQAQPEQTYTQTRLTRPIPTQQIQQNNEKLQDNYQQDTNSYQTLQYNYKDPYNNQINAYDETQYY